MSVHWLVWIALILATIVLPILVLGYEWQHSENCEPDLSLEALNGARNTALMAWFATLVSLGSLIWLSLSLTGSSGGNIWWAFGTWKVISLGLALIATPGCFESYSYLAGRGHPFELLLVSLTSVSWLALIVAIILRARTSSMASHQ